MKLTPQDLQTSSNPKEITPGEQLNRLLQSFQSKGIEINETTIIFKSKNNRYYTSSHGIEYTDEDDAKLKIGLSLKRYLNNPELRITRRKRRKNDYKRNKRFLFYSGTRRQNGLGYNFERRQRKKCRLIF